MRRLPEGVCMSGIGRRQCLLYHRTLRQDRTSRTARVGTQQSMHTTVLSVFIQCRWDLVARHAGSVSHVS